MFRIVLVAFATLLVPSADLLFKVHSDSLAIAEDSVTEKISDRFALWESVAPVGDQQMGSTKDENAYITIHRPEGTSANHDLEQTAVVICPGGGYGGLVVGPEGHGIAKWLGQFGVTGIVLEYRLPRQRHAVPLIDAQRAVRLVRSKAAELGVREDRIGIMGFSAGGHLASTAATHFSEPPATIDDTISQFSCRPDFAVLIYPVVTMMDFTHRGSRNNLLGPEPSPQLIEDYS
ncbi:MAG: alpha/beta hydrolase, partial [Planctomycetota bacterium]|nr:alpha/beta hydrolase [Planctomycetota bacterium]